MTTNEALRDLMKKRSMGIASVGRKLGVGMKMANNRLTSRNMTVNMLHSFCEVFGYKIVLMPADKKTPAEGYEITPAKESKTE